MSSARMPLAPCLRSPCSHDKPGPAAGRAPDGRHRSGGAEGERGGKERAAEGTGRWGAKGRLGRRAARGVRAIWRRSAAARGLRVRHRSVWRGP
eukprot:7117497-Prymnesium_polylepis.1